MGIKEIVVLIGVAAFGYWLGTSGALSRFLPGS